MGDVSIIIPTFRRPDLLRAALESCLGQVGVDPAEVEIVVVDNCAQGSARQAVAALAATSPAELVYVHEPRSGISHARNAGLAAARGAFVAFIDDDEVASAEWLSHLLGTRREHDADVVLAPVLPEIRADRDPAALGFYRDFFTYSADVPTGTELGSGVLTPFWSRGERAYPRLASGNALLRKACLADTRFDPRLGRTGGEDTLFFNQLLADGARIVWCAEAIAREAVPEDRLRLGYVLPRAFRGGQITSRTPLMLRRPRPMMTALAMAIGAVQLPVHLVAGAAGALVRAPRRYHHYAAAATALGKLLWMPPFRRKVYGEASGTPALGAASPSGGSAQ